MDTRRADVWHLGCLPQVAALFVAACDGLSRHGSAGSRVEGGVGQRGMAENALLDFERQR